MRRRQPDADALTAGEKYVQNRVFHLLEWHQRLRNEARFGLKEKRARYQRLAYRVGRLIEAHMNHAKTMEDT